MPYFDRPPNEHAFSEPTDEIKDDEIEFAPGLPQVEAEPAIATARGGSQATVLVQLADTGGAELFHTPDGEPFASVPVGSHRETWPLSRKGFKNWLRRLFYEQTDGAPNTTAMQDALGVLGGKALFDGPKESVHTRVGEQEGAIYHDLADEEWRAVEITAEGWRVVAEPPVHFRRTRGQAPLPDPERGGSLDELRPFLNASSDDDFHLFVGCLVQTLRPAGPFVGYATHGEQGSAKSTRARIFRALVDPNSAPLRSAPRDERDLMIAATNAWVVTLDNQSWLPHWLSDALCRVLTGGGLGGRELYTDSDEILFDAQRTVLINGIEEVALRGDLLDRLVIAHLPRIPDEQRWPESEFWAEFDEAKPRLYGALLDAVSCALRNVAEVKLERHPRMADAARWVTAAEPALGWEHGTFLDAYRRNRADADELALEASPLAQLVREFGEFVGSATELLRNLNEKAGEEITRRKSWPKSGQALSGQLRRLAPNLRANGVDVEGRAGPGSCRPRPTREPVSGAAPGREGRAGREPARPLAGAAPGVAAGRTAAHSCVPCVPVRRGDRGGSRPLARNRRVRLAGARTPEVRGNPDHQRSDAQRRSSNAMKHLGDELSAVAAELLRLKKALRAIPRALERREAALRNNDELTPEALRTRLAQVREEYRAEQQRLHKGLLAAVARAERLEKEIRLKRPVGEAARRRAQGLLRQGLSYDEIIKHAAGLQDVETIAALRSEALYHAGEGTFHDASSTVSACDRALARLSRGGDRSNERAIVEAAEARRALDEINDFAAKASLGTIGPHDRLRVAYAIGPDEEQNDA